MQNKYIYLVFSKTGTWLSSLIAFITRSPYTHVALSFDDKFDTLYSFGRLNPDNPFSGGFAIESLHEGIYKKSSSSHCIIFKISITSLQLNKLKTELNKFLYSNKVYKYNFLGLFFVLWDKPYERENHYFCSQFITTLLQLSGIWYSSKHPTLTRPMDLFSIKHKEIVFEGYVRKVPTIEKALMA